MHAARNSGWLLVSFLAIVMAFPGGRGQAAGDSPVVEAARRGDVATVRALGITPEFVAGFQQIGYRHLSADRLVELKALGVTPEFARAEIGGGNSLPETDDLVEMKLFGRKFR